MTGSSNHAEPNTHAHSTGNGSNTGPINGVNHVTTLDTLLRYKADPNLQNHVGETPLHLAVMYNNVQLVREILHNGCSVDLIDGRSRSPLLYAENETILRQLLSHGASVTVEDNSSNIVLHRLARNVKVKANLVTIVLEKGADVNKVNMFGETPIFGACASGSEEKVKVLVTGGADTKIQNSSGQTLLHTAMSQGHSHLACFIIQHYDILIDAKDNTDNSALTLAINKRQHDVIAAIVRGGGDVNIRGGDGILPATRAAFLKENQSLQFLLDNGALFEEVVDAFPLHTFAKLGDIKTVAYLVENNVSMDRVDLNKQTALHVAIQGAKWDVVEYLLNKGASVAIADSSENTALHLLCKYCRVAKLHECLLSRQANLNATNRESETPLHVCTTNNDLAAVKLLIVRGVDCKVKDSNGRTALHACVAHASSTSAQDNTEFQAIASLVAANGTQEQFDDLDKSGIAILHYLAALGWCDPLITILGLRASVNIRDSSGQTPLHYACEKGHLEVATTLVRRGADVRAADSSQQTALYQAVKSGNEELVEYILGCDADPNSANLECLSPLHTAIGEKKFEIAEILMMNEADVNVCDVSNRTPLHIASPLSPSHVVESLVLHGSDVNVADKDGRTPLHASVYNPDTRVMKYLLSQGAEVDAKDNRKNTPLHLAAARGSYEEVDLLLTAKVRLDDVNSDGDTPLHLAALNVESDVVELLVANEANSCIQNGLGLTPLMVAIQKGSEESAQVLLDHEAEQKQFDPDLGDRQGNTAALYAAKLRPFSIPLIKMIREHGASFECKNNNGETPLGIIKQRKDIDIDRVFLALRIANN